MYSFSLYYIILMMSLFSQLFAVIIGLRMYSPWILYATLITLLPYYIVLY